MATRTQKDVQQRLDGLREQVDHHLHRYHVLDEPEISDAEYDRLFDELKALEEEHPDLITPDSPTQRVGAPPSERFQKAQHLTPMGSLEKVTDDESLFKWADDVRKRLDSDEPVAYVIEPKIDGLAINLTYEDGRLVRGATRGDGVQGEDVTVNLRTIPSVPLKMRGDGLPAVAEVRGEVYMPLSGFRELNERVAELGPEARTEPAQRGRRLAAPEGLLDHRLAAARGLGLRHGRARGRGARLALGGARVAARARLPHEPVRRAARDDRGGGEALRRLGAQAHRARLRDRRDRDQGRLARAAGGARRAALAAALGARVQVGADDRGDDAEQDRDPRRPHGRAQPLGDARARAGRRRHRLAGDAPQPGRHQPQGHPRGRPRDRPARRRRDPADRRSRGRARRRARSRSRCRKSARFAGQTSSSPRARRCTAAPTARVPRAGSRR